MADTPLDSTALYLEGEYAGKYPDWHRADAPVKAANILAPVLAAVDKLGQNTVRIADIGAGVGAVVVKLWELLAQERPAVTVKPVGFEIAPDAFNAAKAAFPELEMHQKFLDVNDGPFDLTLFVDVLEHVENPWELLRTTRQVSRFMIVRQPLLEGFSTFRHNAYAEQRQTWGHIGFFTYRFFLDMAAATGWRPIKTELAAPWELNGGRAS